MSGQAQRPAPCTLPLTLASILTARPTPTFTRSLTLTLPGSVHGLGSVANPLGVTKPIVDDLACEAALAAAVGAAILMVLLRVYLAPSTDERLLDELAGVSSSRRSRDQTSTGGRELDSPAPMAHQLRAFGEPTPPLVS